MTADLVAFRREWFAYIDADADDADNLGKTPTKVRRDPEALPHEPAWNTVPYVSKPLTPMEPRCYTPHEHKN